MAVLSNSGHDGAMAWWILYKVTNQPPWAIFESPPVMAQPHNPMFVWLDCGSLPLTLVGGQESFI